jgi:ABC-type oligopeptide transport system substrate-binding subunit
MPQLLASYGPKGSKKGPRSPQFFESPENVITALFFNANRPLFHNARVRLAAVYALDRTALTTDFERFAGPAQVIDQYLPTFYPGAPARHLLPVRPDLSKARALAAGHAGVAVMYAFPGSGSTEAIVTKDLAAIGITVVTKEIPQNTLLTAERAQPAAYDIFLGGYGGSYQDPADILDPSVQRSGPIASNRFTDPTVDRQLTAAARLSGRTRIQAYARLDRELVTRLAPSAPYAVGLTPDFLAARVGCDFIQPVYGIDLAALCLKKR